MLRETENKRPELTKSQIRTLLKHLNSLCQSLDRKYNINCGGCCYVAYKLFKGLKVLGIKSTLVIASYEEVLPNPQEYYEKIKSRDTKYFSSNDSFNHYFIEVPEFGMINCDGYESESMEFIEDLNSSDILFIYKNSEWNDSYQVSNNKHVSKILNSFFKDVLQKL